MIDIKWIRSHPAEAEELCARRKCDVSIERLLALDEEARKLNAQLNSLQHERKSRRGPVDREQATALKQATSDLERSEKAVRSERDALLARMPNLLAPDTPEGEDDSANVELRRWGEQPRFDFEPKTHEAIGAALGILDLERGAAVAGSGFYYWRGAGARLVWAIFSLALDFLARRGFEMMLTPVVARERTFFGTGYLPFSQDELYKVEGEDLSLIGTSEQTLVAYHQDQILPPDSLPLCYTAFSPCFRTEAGAYGRASRGAFRVHQFHKVEQIVFCHPDESERWHERCLLNETEFMELLGLPHRVVRVCVGDLGAPAYKKYDVEAWFAGFGQFRETHSNTNLLDFQTRRLNIRCRAGASLFLPHTISATMITDRAALAILENNQQADGSVVIPEALRPLLGSMERIAV